MAKRRDKQTKKASKTNVKSPAVANGSMKMTMYTTAISVARPQVKERRPGRPASGKRIVPSRSYSGKARSMARRSMDHHPCDNSNDSGLGFDHHVDQHHALCVTERLNWSDETPNAKRPKVEVKLENDEINDNYSFPEHAQTYRDDNTTLIRTAPSSTLSSLSVSSIQTPQTGRAVPRCLPLSTRSPSVPVTLTTQLQSVSKHMDIALSIIAQPEQQHRARYQTEGSRGAVKDRSGNGFPVVKLTGYNKPCELQVFIGSDMGKVSPHMFYQACRVSGKNSTACSETKIEGTIVIEMQFDPAKDMQVTCDCVGILKERNVDVEHRFPEQLGSRSKKKSTRCRMVFRTTVTRDDGTQETLQVCSQPIICTQPPGVPEICKKSLTSCPASGGLELFIIGKNFLKDTKVSFQMDDDERHPSWEQSVVPDKEFLQQTHLVCVVPPYLHVDITEPVTVRLHVTSSGKTSEAHQFVYTPVNGAMPSVHMDGQQQQQQQQQVPLFSKMLWTTKQEQDIGMMPPPGTSLVPLRRSSTSLCSNDVVITSPPLSRSLLKQELVDENSQNSIIDPSEILPNVGRYRHISESSLDVHQGDSNLSMINENSMDMMNTQMSTNCNNNENSNMSMDNSMDHHQMTMSRSSQFDAMDESSNFMSNGNSEVSATAAVSAENLKVMDLTMKLPMATVPLTMAAMPDLSSTNAPSMATLRSFGVTGNMNMPTQSAQSVENYLTNIENKTAAVLLSNVSNAALVQSTTPFMNAHLLRDATNNEVPKRDGSDDGIVTPITSSERLDAIVNCAVDLIQKENVLLNGDVIMNPALSPMMATNISPNGAAQMSVSAKSPTISPTEVMLNGGQLSPNLMSTHMTTNSSNLLAVTEPEKAIILNAAADLLATTKKLNELQAIPDAAMPEILATATNNDVMNMTTRMPNGAGALYTTAANSGMAKTMVVTQQPPTGVVAMQETTGYAGVLNAATINGMVSEKKLEDVLQVSTTLASMSENDLIDIINPSCFDQV